jgi:hypothetical protein
VDDSITLTEPIQAYAGICCQVVPANLIITNSETNEGEVFDKAGNVAELNPFSRHIQIAAPQRPRPGLILGLALVALVGDMASPPDIGRVRMQFDFNVRLKAT